MNRMRLKIASRLKEAQNTNAMLTTFNEIDMSYIMEFRKLHQEAFLKKYGIKLGFMSAFCKAAAYALADQPTVNAVIDDASNVSFAIQISKCLSRFKRFKILSTESSTYATFPDRKSSTVTTSISQWLSPLRKASSYQFCVTSRA